MPRTKSRHKPSAKSGRKSATPKRTGLRSTGDAAFPGRRHDHGSCRSHALARAERICAERGVRLTALRARVLELVWRSHKPVGAYDVLDLLARERDGAAPPTVYRALQFLTDHGLVHRIESLNAYIGCSVGESGSEAGGACAGGSFLICRHCGAAAELNDPGIDDLIAKRAAETGFVVAGSTVEVEGLCPDCRKAGAE